MNPHFASPSMQAAYLRTIPAIRERCSKVHALAQQGNLDYFDYNPAQESSAVNYCLEIMKVSLESTCGCSPWLIRPSERLPRR